MRYVESGVYNTRTTLMDSTYACVGSLIAFVSGIRYAVKNVFHEMWTVLFRVYGVLMSWATVISFDTFTCVLWGSFPLLISPVLIHHI